MIILRIMWFTVRPSRRRRRWVIRRPQRMCSEAISRKRCLSLASSRSMTLPPWRWLLPHHATDPTLGCPVTLLQDRDGPAPALWAQKFPVAPQGAPHGARRSLSIRCRALLLPEAF
jgi:hypothetical protein